MNLAYLHFTLTTCNELKFLRKEWFYKKALLENDADKLFILYQRLSTPLHLYHIQPLRGVRQVKKATAVNLKED